VSCREWSRASMAARIGGSSLTASEFIHLCSVWLLIIMTAVAMHAAIVCAPPCSSSLSYISILLCLNVWLFPCLLAFFHLLSLFRGFESSRAVGECAGRSRHGWSAAGRARPVDGWWQSFPFNLLSSSASESAEFAQAASKCKGHHVRRDEGA